jgi:hypothetical protein
LAEQREVAQRVYDEAVAAHAVTRTPMITYWPLKDHAGDRKGTSYGTVRGTKPLVQEGDLFLLVGLWLLRLLDGGLRRVKRGRLVKIFAGPSAKPFEQGRVLGF